MTDLTNRVPGALQATPRSQFEAMRDQRRNLYAGSGMIEPGKNTTQSGPRETQNNFAFNGMYGWESVKKRIYMGRLDDLASPTEGKSKSNYPIFNVDGIALHVRAIKATQLVNVGIEAENALYSVTSIWDIDDAPDAYVEINATTTRDYVLGDFVVVDDDIYVCVSYTGATTGQSLTNTALFERRDAVSREDVFGLEVFLVELGEGGDRTPAVYPYGNVQCGLTEWKGQTLSNTVMDQAYSARNSEDTVTQGMGMDWTELSAQERIVWVSDPDNNIIETDGKYYQWQYRLRSWRGIGQEFYSIDLEDMHSQTAPRPLQSQDYTVAFQGRSLTTDEYSDSGNRTLGVSNGYSANSPGVWSLGIVNSSLSAAESYFIPLCRITRFNKGGYHPRMNPFGTRRFHRNTDDGSSDWSSPNIDTPITTADCFKYVADEEGEGVFLNSGDYDSGLSGHPMGVYHDVIYNGIIDDLRHFAAGYTGTPDTFASDIAYGRIRGWERVRKLFGIQTTITSLTNSELVPAENLSSDYNGGSWVYNVTKGMLTPAMRYGTTTSLWSLHKDINPMALFDQYGSTGNAPSFITDGWEVGDTIIIIGYTDVPLSFHQVYGYDVVCTPERLLGLMGNANPLPLVGGNWVPVIPDGTPKQILPQNIPCKVAASGYQRDGVSWISSAAVTAGYGDPGGVSKSTSDLHIDVMPYLWYAGFLIPDNNYSPLDLKLSDIHVAADWRVESGAVTCLTLTGKKPTGQGEIGPVKYPAISYGWRENTSTYIMPDGSNSSLMRHNDIGFLDNSDGIKFFTQLFRMGGSKRQLVTGWMMFKGLTYNPSTDPVSVLDVTNGLTVDISVGERFTLVGVRDRSLEGMVLVATQPITTTWAAATFDSHTVNQDDGRIYREDGTFVGSMRVEYTNLYGDDGTFTYTGRTAFMGDLNDRMVAYGTATVERCLGLAPKSSRR